MRLRADGMARRSARRPKRRVAGCALSAAAIRCGPPACEFDPRRASWVAEKRDRAVSTSPAISVVMPAYNATRFVGAAVESILAQTFENFEFIIVDDCSTDGSSEVLRRYAERDRRIR